MPASVLTGPLAVQIKRFYLVSSVFVVGVALRAD